MCRNIPSRFVNVMLERPNYLTCKVLGIVIVPEQSAVLKTLPEVSQCHLLVEVGFAGNVLVREVHVHGFS